MPIRPENRKLYPSDWPEIRSRILTWAGDRCELCGVSNHEWGFRDPSGGWNNRDGIRAYVKKGARPPFQHSDSLLGVEVKIIEIVLTIMHLDHDPTNNNPENLRAACQQCHNRYDAENRAAGIRERRRRKVAKQQSDLFKL